MYQTDKFKLFAKLFVLIALVACSPLVQAACSATINSFPPSFNGNLTITNDTGSPVSTWEVVMTFADGSIITGGNVTVINTGPPSTIGPVSFNNNIAAGASIGVFYSGSGGADGGTPPTVTGDLCGPVVANEGLTIEKIITSDNGETATLDDFDVSFNDGAVTTEVSWTDATSMTGGIEIVSTVAGTYTLSELDFPNYTEGVWSCTDDADNSVVPVTNGGLFSGADVVVATGQAVTCSITNDDDAPVIPLPTEVPATVCSVDVNSFDQAAQWLSNGADPFAGTVTGSGATFLSSASSFVPGPGISVNTSNTTAVITGATEANFSAAYMAGDFIDYTIQTIGASAVSRLVENGGRDGTAPYQMDVLVSDNGFVTAERILSNYEVDTAAPTFSFISNVDDGLEQLILDAGSQYQFRVVFYGANPSNSNILMDDFAITLDTCPVVSSLTIEKIITSDNGGAATLDDFDISIDDGTGASEIAWATPTSLIGGSQAAAAAAGTYTLSELDSPNYTEGVWSCTDDADGSVVTVSNSGLFSGADVVVADGQAVTCIITNDDEPPTLTVTKSTNTAPDFAGNTAVYTIVVTNDLSAAANDVEVTDIPEIAGFTFASSVVTLNGGATRSTTSDPTIADNPMAWSSFSIPAGDSIEIEVTMDVDSAVPSGVYDNSVNLNTSNPGAVLNDFDGTDAANTTEDIIIYQPSTLIGNLVINEVLYRATGNSAAANDEFIELYNAGTTPIDLSGLMLIDGNKVTNDLDGTVGSITGDTMSFDFTCTDPDQVCSGSTVLAPGDYAVIWVGDQDLATKNASGASFQAWLGQTQKLANGADDVWLFGPNNEFIDYIAWGSLTANSVDPDFPAGSWDTSAQTTLAGTSVGTSISLTPNGVDSDDSNCWEETLSADSATRCTGYLPTIDTDIVGTRVTSVGGNNNGGTIIIQKQTLPDGSTQSFDFSGDIIASLTDGELSTPQSVSAGTYTVTETVVTDWSVTSIVCDDTDSTGDISSATATFNVAAGETITCVFTNSQAASLTLNKTVNNTIGTATPDLWTLDASLASTSVLNGSNGVSLGDLTAGDYVLSESGGPAGYTIVDLVCDDGTLNTTTNTLTLEEGDNAICTFTNRDLITDLQITKTVSNVNPIVGETITFELTVTNNGPDDATNIVVDDTLLAGFSFIAGSMTGGDSQNQTAPGLVWTISSLSAGGATNVVTLTYQATVN